MFFEGSLQEGIATALQQSKLVVCFVTDGKSESQLWETEFLAGGVLREPLSSQAVVLKLLAGSTEAGYLAALFPLPKTPTLVIISKGQLKEYITSGVSKEEFIRRTAQALGAQSQEAGTSAQPAAPSSTSATTSTSTPQPAPSAQPAPAPPAASATPPPPAAPQPSATVQTLLTERAARLEAQRKREAEQRRADKGKAKATADAAPASQRPEDVARAKHAEDLRRRQRQAREDRARVLQAIADDRAARRARAAEREAERRQTTGGADESAGAAPFSEKRSGAGGDADAAECKLQIRLFDGSTVRGKWPAAQSLAGEVRAWLDGQTGAAGGGAYGFKVVQTPLPSRSIAPADEGRSLRDLGLAPSATLVLVPAAPGSGAYPAGVGRNPVVRIVMAVLGVVTGLWALIVGFLGALLGGGAAGSAQEAVRGRETGGSTGVATGRDEGRKGGLRQLRTEGEKDGQQFYNGNSTNFEPRKDDDEQQ